MEVNQILSWLVMVAGYPVVHYLKNLWGWKDKAALFIASAVSVVIALVAMFVSGEVTLENFSLANLPGVAAQVFAVATIAFNLLKK